MHVHLFRLDTQSRHWYAQCYTPDRKRHRFSCRTRERATARRFAEGRLSELDTRMVIMPRRVDSSGLFVTNREARRRCA